MQNIITNNIRRFSILATLAGFLLATLISYAPVKAATDCNITDKINPLICFDQFYGSNDIIFYDPNAQDCEAPIPTSSGSGSLVGNSNAEKIFTYLVGKGLTAEQAAGVLGNFQQESGFDPAIIQGGQIAGPDYTPVNGVGFGIAQWTFTARQAPLVNLAQSTNRKVIDLGLQLDFLWQELTTTHSHALATLKAETTPERAAYVFHRDFEGSADSEAFVIEVRGGNARELYEQFKDLVPGSSSGTPTSSGTADCGPGAGTGTGGITEFMGTDFIIYNQCNTTPFGGPWGDRRTPYGQTMCSAACGPTALAMLSVNMTGMNITPTETIDYYTANNYWYPAGGSLKSALAASAGAFGLTASTVINKGDIAAYKEVFDRGGLITASSIGTSPFLLQGHTIILRGITADGSKFLIADPGYRETNISPANEISVDKILTDIRSDNGSVVYAYYKK